MTDLDFCLGLTCDEIKGLDYLWYMGGHYVLMFNGKDWSLLDWFEGY